MELRYFVMVLHDFFIQIVQFPNLSFVIPLQFTLHLLVHVGQAKSFLVVVISKLVVQLPDFIYIDLLDLELVNVSHSGIKLTIFKL